MAQKHGAGRMMEATVSISDRLIGATPVTPGDEKAGREPASFGVFGSSGPWTPRCVSVSPSSESSATNAWNQNYNTSNPGNQNNNNKTNNNRARACRRTEAPCCNITPAELFQAYYDCRTRKRNTHNALAFERRLERNLLDLYHELHAGAYAPGRSLCLVVTHPKPREIWAADFRDRIVHHLLYNRIAPDFYRAFSVESAACIPGRGRLYAVERLTRHLRSATQDWTVPRSVLQMDLANFFVSIDKAVLDGLLARRIHDPYTLHLARLLLHHDPTTNVHVRSSAALMRTIPPHKSLFTAQGRGRGLPIGNLTSQFFANVYLDPLDQFIKREPRQRYYTRYVDDLVIVSQDGQTASDLHTLSRRIATFARDTLHAKFHPRKTHLQPAEQGINFVGYVVRSHARYLRRRTLATAHYRLRHLPADPATARQSLNSYLGLLRHTDGWRQRQALAHAARAHGLRINTALTKALLPAPTHRADRLVIA